MNAAGGSIGRYKRLTVLHLSGYTAVFANGSIFRPTYANLNVNSLFKKVFREYQSNLTVCVSCSFFLSSEIDQCLSEPPQNYQLHECTATKRE